MLGLKLNHVSKRGPWASPAHNHSLHYIDVIMTTMASQITSLTIVYSTVYSGADQRKYQSSTSLAFVWGIHRDRWIPRTKGQLRGKCFHLMTSSCVIRIITPQLSCNSLRGRFPKKSVLCLHLSCWTVLRTHKHIFAFSVLSRNWYGSESWKTSAIHTDLFTLYNQYLSTIVVSKFRSIDFYLSICSTNKKFGR